MMSASTIWSAAGRWPLSKQLVRVGILALTCTALSIQLAIEVTATNGRAERDARIKEARLASLSRATVPLRGLDGRMREMRKQIDTFYGQRLPSSYSLMATSIRELEAESGVHLSQVVYTERAKGTKLTEVSISSGISGEYPQIMRFVNNLERDQTFFVIRAMTLTGQQGGQVNLRLRFSTWLRNSNAVPSELPVLPETDASPGDPPGVAKMRK